jgi:hypothetical protein
LPDSDLLPPDMIGRKTLDMQGELKKLLLGSTKSMLPKLDGNALTNAMQSLKTLPTMVIVHVKTMAEGVPAQLVDEILGVGTDLAQKVDNFKKELMDTVDGAKTAIAEACKAAYKAFNIAVETFDAVEKAFQTYLGVSLTDLAKSAKMPDIKFITNKLKEAVLELPALLIKIRALPSTLKNAINDIKKAIVNAVENLKTKATTLLGQRTNDKAVILIRAQITNLPQKAKEIAMQVAQSAKDKVETIVEDAAKQMFTVVKIGAAESATASLANAAKEIAGHD